MFQDRPSWHSSFRDNWTCWRAQTGPDHERPCSARLPRTSAGCAQLSTNQGYRQNIVQRIYMPQRVPHQVLVATNAGLRVACVMTSWLSWWHMLVGARDVGELRRRPVRRTSWLMKPTLHSRGHSLRYLLRRLVLEMLHLLHLLVLNWWRLVQHWLLRVSTRSSPRPWRQINTRRRLFIPSSVRGRSGRKSSACTNDCVRVVPEESLPVSGHVGQSPHNRRLAEDSGHGPLQLVC